MNTATRKSREPVISATFRWARAATLMAALACGGLAQAAKVDVIKLVNGDYVTGEVKNLKKGKLSYGTDSMGTISVEWDEIMEVTAKQYYRLETSDGSRYFGSLGPGRQDGYLTVSRLDQTTELEMIDIVRIQTIENNWREQIDSTLKAGYSYTKASEVQEFNLNYDALYIRELSRINFGAGGRTTDDGDETTSQWNAYTDYRRWLKNRNYWLALGGAESNDELGLDLRLIGGGGFGHRFWQTNLSELFGEGGVVVNHTENSDGSSDTELEGLFRTGYSVYIHDTPKRTLNTALALFPGITEFGEYRTDFDITLRQEIIEDFFWDLSFYHKYDSDVSDEDASNSDYGVNTSLGFEF